MEITGLGSLGTWIVSNLLLVSVVAILVSAIFGVGWGAIKGEGSAALGKSFVSRAFLALLAIVVVLAVVYLATGGSLRALIAAILDEIINGLLRRLGEGSATIPFLGFSG